MEGVTGIVLAGGQGRRMGGVDKGLQPLRGRPMVAWAIERLAPQVDELLAIANAPRSAGGVPARVSPAASAIETQVACAAAISSSGLGPSTSSARADQVMSASTEPAPLVTWPEP